MTEVICVQRSRELGEALEGRGESEACPASSWQKKGTFNTTHAKVWCVLLSRHRRTIQLHTSVISTSNANLLSRYSCQGSIRVGLTSNKTFTAKSAPASWDSAKSREPLSALKAGSNWSAKFESTRSHWIKEWSRSRLKDRPLSPRLISSHLMCHWDTYRSSSELPVARDRICSHSTMRSGLLYIYPRADNIALLCTQ